MTMRIAYLRGDETTVVDNTIEVSPSIFYNVDVEGTLISVEYDARYTKDEAIQAVHDHLSTQLSKN